MRRPWVRRIVITTAAGAVVVCVALGGLYWRLSRGPISLDLATPWLVEAIQEKLGGQQRVEVGGSQIERSDGKTAVRLLDVVLRDGDGTVVASAPKVEVGLSGAGLLVGQIRAERISLVGAEVSVRIETDGKLTVFAGGHKRPIAMAPPAVSPGPTATATAPAAPQGQPDVATDPSLDRNGAAGFASVLAWIDGLGRTGLDGRELSEIGLKNGTLVVEDERENARWTFDNIDVSLNRPQRGGVQLNIQSRQPDRQWSINAAAIAGKDDRRSFRLEAVRVPAKDLLLALRFADLPFKADLPISVRLRAEIGPTGMPEVLQGAIVAEAGVVGGSDHGDAAIPLEHASINFAWNAARRGLLVPLQVVLAGNRFTLLAQVNAPANPGDPWRVQLGGGSIVIGADTRAPVVLNRIQVNARIDTAERQIHVDGGEIGNAEIGLALSGGFDYSGTPRLMLGLAARRMPLATMERLWPSVVAPNVRNWVIARVSRATIERVDIAVNAPMEVLGADDTPIPDDALSVAIVASGAALRPVESLPEIHDADVALRATGRTATVKVGRGTITLPSGRKLTMSDGTFHVPDTNPKPPMSQTHFRMEGTVAAAAELLAMERLRGAAVSPLDPATSRGDVSAQVTVDVPLLKDLSNATIGYAVDAQFTNFAADRLIMNQRVEAANLRVSADNTGYEVKGDVKIAGAAVSVEYRKHKGQAEDEVRMQGVLDDATRARLGFDLAPALTGPVSIKLAGRFGNGKDGRFSIDADLTRAKIDDLLPGLVKPPAKQARATFTLVTKPGTTRLDDVVYDGSGSTVRGSIVVDGSGSVLSANFPVFSVSSGDKASLKVERNNGSGLLVTLRGDVLDGRPFIKSLMAGHTADAPRGEKPKSKDVEVEARIGAIAGHNGEAFRGLELKLSRRDGRIRSLALKARIGRNATLAGDLRPRRSGPQALHIETDDAGALFRFTDIYSRIVGGHMTVTMDPPSSDPAPQRGVLSIENFVVRGEAALDRVVGGAPSGSGSGVEFSATRVDFTRTPGQLSIRDGVLRGPLIGATIDGAINYQRDDVRMRGTLVPLYGLNNMFGRLPIVGLFLGGGSNEGLVGITYEVVGSVSAPTLRVNPISAVAPGFIRKFFEFPSAGGPGRPPGAADSTR